MSVKNPEFSAIKAYTKLFLLILWTLGCVIVFGIFCLIPFLKQKKLLTVFHSGLCFFMGVKVIQQGEISSHQPTLFVSNHVSYLDIPVLGGLIKGYFVAKSEIASWPVINHLCRFQNTIFIERKAARAKQQIQILQDHLQSGSSLILFPEGTSTNGAEVLPLKSSLFAAVETATDAVIQPVSIAYTQHKGQGMNQALRDNFAWYADFPFGSHVFNMLGLGNVTAVVTFNEPLRLSDFPNRKACALACEEAMRDSFEKAFAESGSSK